MTGEYTRRRVTDIEFCLSVAKALLPDLEKAVVFINRALAETVDRRLRSLLLPALRDRTERPRSCRPMDRQSHEL